MDYAAVHLWSVYILLRHSHIVVNNVCDPYETHPKTTGTCRVQYHVFGCVFVGVISIFISDGVMVQRSILIEYFYIKIFIISDMATMDTTYYPVFDETVVEKGDIENGKKTGIWTGRNNSVKISVCYQEGKRNGSVMLRYIGIYNNYKQGVYVNDVLQSPLLIYRNDLFFAYEHFDIRDGMLYHIHRKDLRGVKIGREKIFFQGTNILQYDRTYLDGRLHGYQREYYANKNPKRHQTFNNGVLDGPMHYYNEHGVILKSINYVEGFASSTLGSSSNEDIDMGDMGDTMTDPVVQPINDVCSITMDPIDGCYYKCSNTSKAHYFDKIAIEAWMKTCGNRVCPYDKTFCISPVLYSTR